jgi:PST family polysaccharide transporter
VLRWQILGDILKVASWPMSFILLAQGRGAFYIGI